MQLDWFTFTAQIVNFLILLLLLKRFLYRPVLRVMKNRETEINRRLDEAQLKLTEAEEKSGKYEKKLCQLENQKKEWMQEAKLEAESHKKGLLQKARTEVERVQDKWINSIESKKKQFYSAFEKRTVEKIIELSGQVVTELADGRLEKQALEKFLKKLIETDSEERERIAESVASGILNVVTSFPLDETGQKNLERTIFELFPQVESCSFDTDPELGFGIEIRSNGWKISWNVRNRLEELRAHIDEFINPLLVQKNQKDLNDMKASGEARG